MVGPEAAFLDGQRLLQQGLPTVGMPQLQLHHGQVVQRHGQLRVLRAQHLLPDGHGPLQQRQGLVEAACVRMGRAQVAEQGRHLRILGAAGTLHDADGPLEHRLRRIESALAGQRAAQVVQALRHGGMVGAEPLLTDGQGLPGQCLGSLAVAPRIGQVAQAAGHVGHQQCTFGRGDGLGQRQRPAQQRLGVVQPALRAAHAAQAGDGHRGQVGAFTRALLGDGNGAFQHLGGLGMAAACQQQLTQVA